MKKEIIVAGNVHQRMDPRAHAQAVRVGNLVFTSGQVAVDQEGNMVGRGDVDAQIEQTFENLKRVLEAAGSSLENVVKVTHYSTNVEHSQKLRFARTKYLGKDIASTGVIVKKLGHALNPEDETYVEIDAIAVID